MCGLPFQGVHETDGVHENDGVHDTQHIVRSRNDVLTVLIHLGYLECDFETQECFIPNKEVRDLLVIVYEDAFGQSWLTTREMCFSRE